jgi:hypothetical protein
MPLSSTGASVLIGATIGAVASLAMISAYLFSAYLLPSFV